MVLDHFDKSGRTIKVDIIDKAMHLEEIYLVKKSTGNSDNFVYSDADS